MGRGGAGANRTRARERGRQGGSWPTLVGREQELCAARAWLDDPDARLLTLTGLLGSGRSHLASSIADLACNAVVMDHSLSDDFPTIVNGGDGSLLLLDELTPSDTDRIDALLVDFERLRIVAVAVRPLGLHWERSLRVCGLALPGPDASFREVCSSPSVMLFAARAGAASGFVLDESTAASAVAICAAVDGLPYGIELAAARTSVLPASALADELSRRTVVDALGGALRQVVEHAHDLLSDDAAAMLRDISMLHCSFTLNDAHEIARTSAGRQVIDLLAELDAVHLVIRKQEAGSELRFFVPRLVREVMNDKPTGAGDEVRFFAEVRHALHVGKVVREAASAQFRSGRVAAVDVIDEWFDDALAAVSTLTRVGRDVDAARLGLDIAGRAPAHKRVDEVAGALDRSLRSERMPEAYRAEAFCSLAVLRGHRADTAARDEVRSLLTAGLELADELDSASQLRVLLVMCGTLGLVDDPSVVLQAASVGIDIAESLGDRWAWARLSICAAAVRQQLGERAEAQAWDAYGVACALDDPFLRVRTSLFLRTTRSEDDGRPVLPSLVDLVDLATVARDELGRGAALLALASESLGNARWQETADAIDGMFTVSEQLDSWPLAGHAFMLFVVLSSLQGDHALAARFNAVVTRVRDAVAPSAPSRETAAYEHVVAATRIALGTTRFSELEQQGAAMSWSSALTEARCHLRAAGAAGVEEPPIDCPALTDRELEVVMMLAEGYTNKDVARQLGVTAKTVMHHNASIYRKLGVRSRAGAVSAAVRLGLLHGTRAETSI